MQFNQKLLPNIIYWIVSDLHFGHNNIVKYCPNTRPYRSVSEMDENLIAKWNSTVAPNDVVFHLGDFSFYGAEKTRDIISRLNGHIVFIKGNHDKTLDQIGGLEKHYMLEVRCDGTKVVMCHYAMRAWNQQHRGAVMLFGHSHGSMPDFGRSTDVGWDSKGGISNLRSLVNTLLKREIVTEDNH